MPSFPGDGLQLVMTVQFVTAFHLSRFALSRTSYPFKMPVFGLLQLYYSATGRRSRGRAPTMFVLSTSLILATERPQNSRYSHSTASRHNERDHPFTRCRRHPTTFKRTRIHPLFSRIHQEGGDVRSISSHRRITGRILPNFYTFAIVF